MSSRNNNLVTISEGAVKKKYQSLDRYESEIYWQQWFFNNGFRVPRILHSNPARLTNTIERIRGASNEPLTTDNLIKIIDKLKSIQNLSEENLLKDTGGVVTEEYSKNLKKHITLHCEDAHLSLSHDVLNEHLTTLRRHFRCSLFKDAKPSNWIIAADDIYMIDFDYVKPSFFLADLAQLLNYSAHVSVIDQERLLNRFIGTSTTKPETVRILFKLARVNACLMAIRYGRLDRDPTTRRLTDILNTNLKELGVIHV